MDARETYTAGIARAEAQARVQESKIRGLGVARLLVAVAVIGAIGSIVWGHLPGATWGLVLGLTAVFGGLVLVHAKAFAEKERAVRTLAFHQRGLARLGTAWRSFPGAGAGRVPPDHPYAEDLDLFGPASLFQLLDATETPFGQDALAAWLTRSSKGTPSWALDVAERQAAVRDLGARVDWREKLAVEGALLRRDAPDPGPFLSWAEGRMPLEVPGAVVIAARVLPLLVLISYLAAPIVGLPRWSWLGVVAVELLVAWRYRVKTAAIAETVSADVGGFARYGALFAVAASAARMPDLSPRVAKLLAGLDGPEARVTREMASLERIVGFIEARRNEVFKLFLGPVLMWDLNFAVLLEGWRKRAGGHVREWFETLGQIEAFASLGGFAFDRPDHAWPELTSEAQLRAVGLGHPLIDPARRVGNDVTLAHPGTALVVTGSNMSGKSTLLRALGVNTVLAQMGAPVCAKSYIIGRVTLATSMRISDSLDQGVSHFYAEIKKLKRVVDLGRTEPPVLFLLDEILHGTNSRERIIGARAIIDDLLSHGALGAVSTHDLGIATAQPAASPERLRNVHFEEQVEADGTMTFDYHLREGLVQSSNALRLMRAIGLDVPLEAGPSAPAPAALTPAGGA